MAFYLSGKVVALNLDNSTAKAYLCNQGGTVSPFLSRLACQILHLTSKHSITLIPAYMPTHLNVEIDYLSWDQMLLEWHLLPQVGQAAFHLWGLPEVDLLASFHSTQCQHYYTLESPLPLGALGLNAFSHLWTFLVSYMYQMVDSGGTVLDGGSLAQHSFQCVGRCSSALPHHKRYHCGCLSRPATQDLPYLHLTL